MNKFLAQYQTNLKNPFFYFTCILVTFFTSIALALFCAGVEQFIAYFPGSILVVLFFVVAYFLATLVATLFVMANQ